MKALKKYVSTHMYFFFYGSHGSALVSAASNFRRALPKWCGRAAQHGIVPPPAPSADDDFID